MEGSKIFILGLILINIVNLGFAEVFTAIENMKDLLPAEAAVIEILKSFITDQEEKLIFLKKRLSVYEVNHAKALNNSNYLTNPVNAYLITKRLSRDLVDLVDRMIEGINDQIFDELDEVNGEEVTMPTMEDLFGTAQAVVRIQDTYDLDVHSIAKGDLGNEGYNLTASDCYEIAYAAYNKSMYTLSLPWFEKAYERRKDGSFKDIFMYSYNILGYSADALAHIGNYTGAIKILDRHIELAPNDETIKENRRELQMIHTKHKDVVRNTTSVFKKDKLNDLEWMQKDDTIQQESYKQLCRKQLTPSPEQLAPLRCRYVTNKSPFLKIAPLKVEEASLDPYIATYHDVIYDSEIEWIQKFSLPLLARAGVEAINATLDNIDDDGHVDYRIGKSAWFHDADHKYIRDISLRVSDMTGLTLTYAEKLQVLNYGVGGQYETHYDFAFEDDMTFEIEGEGNRIATVLFYLSDVAEGGATVFPILDIALWPKKGSASFWFNLFHSGVGDLRTKHAGCPVLIGSKWIANKWLHLRDQEVARPCLLQPDHPRKI